MKILVIDGQGGRLGRKLLENIRKTCPDGEITAVGTNSIATENMLNSIFSVAMLLVPTASRRKIC